MSEQPGTGASGVTAVVLAGGKSRRYGKNKALERINGVSLIERAVAALGCVFDRVILSANDPEPYDFLHLPVIKDLYPGVGQLGGVHAGLCAMPDETGFFVACDMPFLNPDLIRHMLRLSAGWDAVVPKIGPHVEPLHALYRKTCIAPMVRAIERKERRIVSFYSEVRVRYVEEQEIRIVEPNLDAFINVNRPEELRLSIDLMRRRT
ncbi:MAG: molybdenum cofactor guanylyltransferase [Thermodesulfobacteriota bacterium]